MADFFHHLNPLKQLNNNNSQEEKRPLVIDESDSTIYYSTNNNTNNTDINNSSSTNDFELINKERHLVLLIAGMGARKDQEPLDGMFLGPFGKWFNIKKCQDAMKDELNNQFKKFKNFKNQNNQNNNNSPELILRSIDYCSSVREEGGYSKKLNLVSMKSGVQLFRKIANESMIDVLMYSSEKVKKQMQQIAIKQLNDIYEEYKHLDIKTISIVGHSLGSVVAFDILYQNQESNHTILNFKPDHCFLIGSPLGLFLMMDVQTKERMLEPFHDQLLESDDKNKGKKKRLLRDVGLYHLFHPYDPVAYRIEPHLDQRFANHEPVDLLTYDKRKKTGNNTFDKVTQAFSQMFEKLDDKKTENIELNELEEEYERIDYCLAVQELIINEYLSAGDVHLKYWANEIVCSFILEKIGLLD
ncbi:hypothetical protein ABK040_009646 [Willaertia magna]